MTDTPKPVRRVRILQYALFGAFVYAYFGILISEQLTALIYAICPAAAWAVFIPCPHTFGIIALLIFLPIFVSANKRWSLLKRCGSLTRQLIYFTAFFVVIGLIPVATEQQTLELKTARLIARGESQKALDAGKLYRHESPRMQMLRLKALGTLDRMAASYFSFPVDYHPFSDRIQAERCVNLPIGSEGYSYLSRADSAFVVPPSFSALLDGNLDRFAGTIPRAYLNRPRCESIPLAFRQALVLYVRLTTHPILTYTDEATEANYRDFMNRRDSIRKEYPRDVKNAERAERNLMAADFYGTYWFYYFYLCPDRKFGL